MTESPKPQITTTTHHQKKGESNHQPKISLLATSLSPHWQQWLRPALAQIRKTPHSLSTLPIVDLIGPAFEEILRSPGCWLRSASSLGRVWWVSFHFALGVVDVFALCPCCVGCLLVCGGCLCTAGSRLIWRERPARTGAQPPTGHPPNQTKPKRGFKKAISL